ncbi:MAG: superoxide dismutase [Candidatus Saccharibacteria bacterium]
MFKLPSLNYGYDSLHGFVGEELMKFHHDKHHQTYVDKLNAVIDASSELKGRSVEDLLTNINSLPISAQVGVRNHGGGHYNHSLFWQCLSPSGGGQPTGELLNLITNKYGSFQSFVDEFTTKSLGVFGSGWAWLQPNGEIITTSNQDTPIAQGLDAPLLCLDVWEHAYYLDYKNKRDDYVRAWWNVVDWENTAKRYQAFLDK